MRMELGWVGDESCILEYVFQTAGANKNMLKDIYEICCGKMIKLVGYRFLGLEEIASTRKFPLLFSLFFVYY